MYLKKVMLLLDPESSRLQAATSGGNAPSVDVHSIITDTSHLGQNVRESLPSGRRYRTIWAKASRHKKCFLPKDITLINS